MNLAAEGSEEDRQTAVKALKFQPYLAEILPLAIKALADSSTAGVGLRRNYLDWIYQYQAKIPHLDEILRTYLENETNEDNRKIAWALLESINMSVPK